MGQELGISAQVASLRRLGGGLGSATHAIGYDDGSVVVLKRYPPGSTGLDVEWDGLRLASGAGVPAPEPLGLDLEGNWFGAPAIVMAKAPGRPNVRLRHPSRRLAQVASLLAELHTVSPAGWPRLERPHPVDVWTPPETTPDGALPLDVAGDVVAVLAERMPLAFRGEKVVNHGDFHPGNLLWDRSRLSAIVDWGHAKIGYRAWELAYFRLEAALLVSSEAADEMTTRYWKEAGLAPEPMELWDLSCAFSAHRWLHMWLLGYREQGRSDLSFDELARRLNALVGRALSSLDS